MYNKALMILLPFRMLRFPPWDVINPLLKGHSQSFGILRTYFRRTLSDLFNYHF